MNSPTIYLSTILSNHHFRRVQYSTLLLSSCSHSRWTCQSFLCLQQLSVNSDHLVDELNILDLFQLTYSDIFPPIGSSDHLFNILPFLLHHQIFRWNDQVNFDTINLTTGRTYDYNLNSFKILITWSPSQSAERITETILSGKETFITLSLPLRLGTHKLWCNSACS